MTCYIVLFRLSCTAPALLCSDCHCDLLTYEGTNEREGATGEDLGKGSMDALGPLSFKLLLFGVESRSNWKQKAISCGVHLCVGEDGEGNWLGSLPGWYYVNLCCFVSVFL
ncbi:hypothetical protein BDV12DRAFT_100845 [Aspergillus spectabilis]